MKLIVQNVYFYKNFDTYFKCLQERVEKSKLLLIKMVLMG